MGGVKRYPYPKYVWSPSGGWWCNPPNWKRNTVVAAIISLTIATGIYVTTRKYERTFGNSPKYPERLFKLEDK